MFATRQAAVGTVVALAIVAGAHMGASEVGQPMTYPTLAAQKDIGILCSELTASAIRFFDGVQTVIRAIVPLRVHGGG